MKEIRKIQTQFLQKHNFYRMWIEGRKMVWVKWSTFCNSKNVGGLIIKDINLFNITLLEK